MSDRLEELHAATTGLTIDQQRLVDAYLVGWLSGLVTAEQWAGALAYAVQSVRLNPKPADQWKADLLARLNLPADALDDPGLTDCENCGGPGVIHDDNGHAIACPTCTGMGIVERRPS